MWTLRVKRTFAAAHSLPYYDGPCRRLHGHTWFVEVFIRVAELRTEGRCAGMACDFADVKRDIETVLDELDHHNVNDVISNPTAENIASWIYGRVRASYPDVEKVVVWEGPDAGVEYFEGKAGTA